MSRCRSVGAVLGALLALPLSAVPLAAPEAAGPRAQPRPTPGGPLAAPSSAAPADVPCPAPNPPVGRPSRPATPRLDPARRTVGGDRMATTGLAVPAGAKAPPAVTATSWLVADLNTGAVLGGCGPHEYGVPASVQKLLLAAAFMPDLDPSRVVEVTEQDMDFEPGSSAMGVVRGGRYTVESLWLGLMLNSGNDAANVLARLGGGADGLKGGLREMNAEARRLGAYQTHAATPSGLDGPGQYTSAYDLALIARACFARDDFRRYASTQRAEVPAQPAVHAKAFAMFNDNQLLYHYPGALGGKVGYTDLARHSYVGAAERGGRRLVVTLLGAENQPLSGWQQGVALLDWGFGLSRDASVGRLVERAESPAPGASPAVGVAATGAAEVPARRGNSATPLVATVVTAVTLAAGLLLSALLRRHRARRQRG